MFAPFLTPGSGGAKPKPEPKPEPQKPIVPLVVYTAFDAQTAEELKRRLEETIHPVDQPTPDPKKTTYDPPPYEHEPAKRSKASYDKPEALRVEDPPLVDLPRDRDWEDEVPAPDLELPWSSEAPFLSLDAAEMSDYFSALENDLVREVSLSLQYQKFILFYLDKPLEFLKHFASYNWDEESDAAAEKFILWYVKRFTAELERQLEYDISASAQSDIEYWIRDVANDELESVIVYDLETKETLFVRYGNRHAVTLQDWHQRLSEGRNIVVIHNHPKIGGSSWADLSSAAWLDAEWLLVVNPDGKVHRHQKVGDEIVKLEPLHFPEFVAPVNPVETVLHSIAYWIQTVSEVGNPHEAVFEQGDTAEDEITVDTGSRLVSEFLLNPAAIVFLDDVAKEYGLEDTALFSAMVPTIIYRELQDRLGLGLPNADYPTFQGRWDTLKQLLNAIPFHLQRPVTFRGEAITLIGKLDGDPSLGIGALSMKALRKIQDDAEGLGWDIYLPVIEFDNPSTLDHVPFSRGEHLRDAEFIPGTWTPQERTIRAVPPSNEEYGAWRVELPRFEHRSQSGLQQVYEPTLGYIAAEVAIAMESPEYQRLETDEERIAFIIAYHASRSAEPAEYLYSPEKFSEVTHKEIHWARDFMELMDEIRTEIQSGEQTE